MELACLKTEKGNDMPTKNAVTGVARGGEATDSGEKPKKCRERAQARKRVPMGIALRRHGIDEHTIAETYAFTLDALKGIVPVKDSDKKLLIDFVKECEKHLEKDAQAAPGASLRVRLVHNVARPNRVCGADADVDGEAPDPEHGEGQAKESGNQPGKKLPN
jgi:hypothetical protein